MLKTICAAAILAILLPAGAALAQDDTPPARGVVQLDPIDIFGRQQRPVSYVLVRSGSDYEVRELRASFVREVVQTVQTETFE